MALSREHSKLFTDMRSKSTSKQSKLLTDDEIAYLIRRTAFDLDLLDECKVLRGECPDFFETLHAPEDRSSSSVKEQFSALVDLNPEAGFYTYCLATMYKARTKQNRIEETQPFATMDQVGLRGLLQYGKMSAPSLSALLVWRKWLFDIDNRAAQSTGYFIEPVLANAIGGTPYSSKVSPIKRIGSDGTKARQVDCIKDQTAYEFKVRMTIAASGQGRWKEELSFPRDCQESGYTPFLLVLDPTHSVKLAELVKAYENSGGQALCGDDAWDHLKQEAPNSMKLFIDKYIEQPLQEIFGSRTDSTATLPPLHIVDEGSKIRFEVGEEMWETDRDVELNQAESDDPIPDETAFDDVV